MTINIIKKKKKKKKMEESVKYDIKKKKKKKKIEDLKICEFGPILKFINTSNKD